MGEGKLFKRTLICAVCSLAFGFTGTASAYDWLSLQGTEPEAASVPAKVFGFVQTDYQKDYSKANAAGQYVPPKLLGPNLDSQSGFNVRHVQIGVRGTGFPIDDSINYFALVELGNAATSRTCPTSTTCNTSPSLTDGSITVNSIPYARIRMGLFKYPGAEEGMESTIKEEYIDFSEATNGLLLERFPNTVYTANLAAETPYTFQTTGGSLNGFTKPAGGFRDSGVQVFNTFDLANDWNLSYAVMLGQGSGTQLNNVDGEYDTYYYLSTEKNLATTGPSNGLKFFVWRQTGKRLADITNDLTVDPKLYKRDRSGLGMKYEAKPFRVAAEYINANGMIFEGPDKPSFYFAVPANAANIPNNGALAKGSGWYLDGGFYIPGTKWELDARYDTADFNRDHVDEHRFSKTTLGTKYDFNPMAHLTVNYEIRNFKCTTATTQCRNANANLSTVGNKLGVQLTAAF